MAPVPTTYAFGPFRLDPAQRALLVAGTPLPLGSRAFDILLALIEARDRILSREEIMARVWPGVVVEASNLTVQMSVLRRALGDAGEEAKLIATIPGRGYRFIGKLEQDAAKTTALAVVMPAADTPPASAPDRWQPARLAAGCLVAVLVALLIGWTALPRKPGPPRLSIVVMPFRNLSDDQARGYLADAITDDLTTDLSHIPGSLVIARESADSYKGQSPPVAEVGRALNVRYLLEGSLRADGDTLRINAQLIDTGTGMHLWAERFDSSTTKLWETQTNIVHQIASALNVVLVDTEVARAARERPRDADALDLFFQARSEIERATTLPQLTEGQHLLEQAVAKEPRFVAALSALGWLLVRKQSFTPPTQTRDLAEANTVLATALALTPHDPDVLAARGRLLNFQGKYADAMAAFDEALAAEPSNTKALSGAAMCAWTMGNPAKASSLLESVIRIDPQAPASTRVFRTLGMAYLYNGKYPQAIDFLLRSDTPNAGMEVVTDSITPTEVSRVYLIAAYALNGDITEARQRYLSYARTWKHRSVWQMMSSFTREQARMPGFARVANALGRAGMPVFNDEREDYYVPPTSIPLEGSDCTPTPRNIPGGITIQTAELVGLLNTKSPPKVINVGVGIEVIHNSIVLSDDQAAYTRSQFQVAPFGSQLRQAEAQGVVIMGAGPIGVMAYNTALHFIELGFQKVYWYRGGEEAWAAAGLPATDDRYP